MKYIIGLSLKNEQDLTQRETDLRTVILADRWSSVNTTEFHVAKSREETLEIVDLEQDAEDDPERRALAARRRSEQRMRAQAVALRGIVSEHAVQDEFKREAANRELGKSVVAEKKRLVTTVEQKAQRKREEEKRKVLAREQSRIEQERLRELREVEDQLAAREREEAEELRVQLELMS